MRIRILLLIIFVIGVNTHGQTYMDTIVQKSCECFENTPEENLNDMVLGLCMIQDALSYPDQLMEDYGIDISRIDQEEHSVKLGEIIGLKMLAVCPEQLVKLADLSDDEYNSDYDSPISITGKVKTINTGEFVSLSIKTENNKALKFYWLHYTKTNFDIVHDYKSLKGRDVEIKYSIIELFDPKINEYRNFNVIDDIQLKAISK